MKKALFFLYSLMFFALCIPTQAQNDTIIASDSARLNKVVAQLQSGVFVRTMAQYDPTFVGKDTTKKNAKIQLPTELTNTYYFFRFDSIWQSQHQQQVYLAKLFISERVFEKVFSKKYISEADYKQEVAGMFIMAKVYMENKIGEVTRVPKIRVFPTYTTNIVSKKMYSDADLTLNYTTHLKRLIHEVEEENKDSTFFKEIKCFDLEMQDAQIETLRLSFTKYARSDDEITNSSYLLKFIPYKTSEINVAVAQAIRVDNRNLTDKVVTQNSVLNASQNEKQLVVTDTLNRAVKGDTLIALQIAKPTEAWVYAGMLTKDSTWVVQYVKWDEKYPKQEGAVVSALYRLQLRAGKPYQAENAWRKEKVIYVCESGQKMKVLARQYMTYYKDGRLLLWLKVKLL